MREIRAMRIFTSTREEAPHCYMSAQIFIQFIFFIPSSLARSHTTRDDVAYPRKMCVTKMKGGDFGFFYGFQLTISK